MGRFGKPLCNGGFRRHRGSFAPARAAEVVSSNVVGYQKLAIPANGYAMIANPFVEVGTESPIGIDEMFANDKTDATAGSDASKADNIKIWNGAAFEMLGYFKSTKNGKFWANASGTATTDPFPANAGAFYQSAGTTDTFLTISGQVKSNSQTLSIAKKSYTLLENPFPTGLPIQSFNVAGATAGSDASKADNIKIWNGSGYDSFYFKSTKSGKFWADSTGTQSSYVIPSGTGFFYQSIGDEDFSVTIESPVSAN